MKEMTSLYYDHYKDTFLQIKQDIAKRDRLTIYLILLLAGISYIMIDVVTCVEAINSVFQKHIGRGHIGFSIINTSSLFLLLYIMYGYYQVCLQIEKSYIYLHNIEAVLSELMTINIDRESANYLSGYPMVKSIAHKFYTYILPSTVVTVSAYKAFIEWPDSFEVVSILNEALLFVCIVSSLIYIADRIILQKGISWDHFFQYIHMNAKPFFKYLMYAIAAIIIIPSIALVCCYCLGDIFSANTGYVGDTLGGTTAPFIGLLSIILLIYTFKEQRNFNQKQKEFNEQQTQLSRDEQFKSTFFMLLQEQRDILKSLRATCVTLDKSTTTKVCHSVRGQAFFSMAIFELRMLFNSMEMPTFQSGYSQDEAVEIMESIQQQLYTEFCLPKELREEKEETINAAKQSVWQKYIFEKFSVTDKEYNRYKTMVPKEKIEYVYSKFFCIYENCGYYFRHLYRLMKHIENGEKDENRLRVENTEEIRNKYLQFAEYIQAQMSTNEMLVTFYNCFLFDNAWEIIVKYRLLQNLTKQNLLREDHQRFAEVFNMKDRPNYRWAT